MRSLIGVESAAVDRRLEKLTGSAIACCHSSNTAISLRRKKQRLSCKQVIKMDSQTTQKTYNVRDHVADCCG